MPISPSESQAPGYLLGAPCLPLQPKLVGHVDVTVKDDEDNPFCYRPESLRIAIFL